MVLHSFSVLLFLVYKPFTDDEDRYLHRQVRRKKKKRKVVNLYKILQKALGLGSGRMVVFHTLLQTLLLNDCPLRK